MNRYWGSANKDTGEVWFNSDLADLSPVYLEYLVVHELVHLLSSGHDARFYELMDRHLPGWRKLSAKIEEPPTRYS